MITRPRRKTIGRRYESGLRRRRRRLGLSPKAPPLAVLELVLDRVAEQLGAALEVELLLDVFAVGLDRLDADEEAVGDLADGLALAQELEHLQLPVGEHVERRAAGRGRHSGHLTQQR